MSKRYSRCRSAKLGALCPPMPVFKYAMLTPRPKRQNWRAGIKKGNDAFCYTWGYRVGNGEKVSEVAYFYLDSVKLYFSTNYSSALKLQGKRFS